MDAKESYQLLEEGKMTKSAVEEFMKELTPERREEKYCEWLPKVAVGERFGDEPNKSMVVALRCIERLRIVPKPEEQNGEEKTAPPKKDVAEKVSKNNRKVSKNKGITVKVDEDELCKYFNARFKGAGGNINHFGEFVSDLNTLKTKTECSAIAAMVFDCSGFIRPSHSFARWCRIFFQCVSVSVSDNFNFSNKPQANDGLKKRFYYLL